MLKHRYLIFIGLILGLLIIAGGIIAQQKDKKDVPAHPKVSQQRVNSAIRKGIDYLMKNPSPPLKHTDYNKVTRNVRVDELVLYTVLYSGAEQEEIDKLLEKVLKNELDRVYHVALRAMVLDELDRVKYQEQIKDCAQFLIDNQCANGQWSYGEKTELDKTTPLPPAKNAEITGEKGESAEQSPSKKPKDNYADKAKRIVIKQRRKGPPVGDNSNAQYAALGLRSCMQAGIEIPPEILAKAVKWWRTSQSKDGGWQYSAGGLDTPGQADSKAGYGAMTAGGIGAVCIYDFYLRQNIKTDENIQKAMKWMADNFSVTEHPKYYDKKKHLNYYLYATERAGILASTEFFGNNEWYPIGAEFLLKNQKEDGSWRDSDASLPWVDTCFAILFLRRATKPLIAIETK